MADQEITELTEQTDPVPEDLMHTVDDVSGTPTNKKLGFGTFLKTYNRTASEISESLSNDDLDFKEDEGHALRYGDNATPGTTDFTTAIQTAIDVMKGANAGVVTLPNEAMLTSAELLIDEKVYIVGQGRGSDIQPNAETFAVFRLEGATDDTLSRWALKDFKITYASQATNPAAVGIKFDDSGGVNRFPYGGHIHRVTIDKPYIGFSDDTIAFDIDIHQVRVLNPKQSGFFTNKAASTMYGFTNCWVKGTTSTGPLFDLTGLRFLEMSRCAVGTYNGAQPVVNLVSCSGLISTLDIETSTTTAASLLSLSGCILEVVGGKFSNNVLSAADAGIIRSSDNSRVVLSAVTVIDNTATGSNNTHGITISATTDSFVINGGTIDAPTGGSGSHTDIIDVGNIHSRRDENGFVLKSGRIASGAAVTFTSADATPTVSASNTFITAGTTAITDFDDGVVGQTIKIIGASTIPITDGTPIQLSGSVNFDMVPGDTLTLHMFNDQVWEEIGRKQNATLETYTPTNVSTDRSFDANAAVTGTGIDVADAGPANVALLSDHDALVAVVQEQADVIGTLIADLQARNEIQ